MKQPGTQQKTNRRQKFRHLKKTDRLEIAVLQTRGYSHREIARAMGRDHTTISRELSRNTVSGTYDPRKAQHKAYVRRKYSKYQGMKIVHAPLLRNYLEEKLPLGWSPDVIAGQLKAVATHLPYVSGKTIYKFLYTARGQYLCRHLASARYYRQRRRKTAGEKQLIPHRIGIEMRPTEANNRQRCGDFEGDLIISGKRHHSSAALDVVVSRKSRYVKLKKIANQRAATHNAAVTELTAGFTTLHTLTFDNGVENVQHEALSSALSVDIFFCNPYASWEKGSIENINGLIRRWIPKGANIADYTDEQIQWIEDRLNHTPRKSLGYRTPYEVMLEDEALLPEVLSTNQSLILKQKQHRGGAVEG